MTFSGDMLNNTMYSALAFVFRDHDYPTERREFNAFLKP